MKEERQGREGILSERTSGRYADEVVRNYLKPRLSDSAKLIPDYYSINRAHLVMLTRRGIVSKDDATTILRSLREINALGQGVVGDRIIDDVYVAIETTLVGMVGEEVGGRMHTGRSRNEMTVCVMRMECRRRLLELVEALIALRGRVLALARTHTETVMPGFTHFQNAEPMTFGFYLCALAEALGRDLQRLEQAYSRVNVSPMGAGALVGTEYRIDRELTAELLGFDGVITNAMDSVSNHDGVIEGVFAETMVTMTLGRLAEDLVVWSSPRFGMVELADGYVGTSSIMPQKRNPIMAELLRSSSSVAMGQLASLMTMVRDLPGGFNMDYVQLNRIASGVGEHAAQWVEIAAGLVGNLRANKERMKELAGEGFSTATDLANLLASRFGISFRTAHRIVGRAVKRAVEREEAELDLDLLKAAFREIVGREMDLDGRTMRERLDVVASVTRIRSKGGTSPRECRAELRKLILENDESARWASGTRSRLEQAEEKLEEMCASILGSS